MTNSAPRAIVAGHGDFAAGLVSAVEVITGRGEVFHAVAVPELSAADIEVLLRETMEQTGARVLFTDLPRRQLHHGGAPDSPRHSRRGVGVAAQICRRCSTLRSLNRSPP